ncbi:hypothetical protein A0H81_10107 [Grifola frondosa]|uniref:BTB domain-containing protein n=1 Tax=Grifola frondosa TaxID=5627 RepID=A0A1C7LXN8_GRIFR|nr:hypothetical protein A0H81_10107 [Grifola frondosa]
MYRSPDSAVEKLKRHSQYYLAGGDIYFLVENFVFRVHKYFFERESGWFREKFSLPASPGQAPRGSSEANPFPLDDLAADDFARFLWVFYNPMYSIYDAKVEDWEVILKLAYDWRFPEVKRLASRQLEKLEIPPVEKIALYQTYELDKKLLIPSFAALCSRTEPLTFAEGTHLGLETALLIARAREWVRGQSMGSSVRSPSPVSVGGEDMVAIIREVFSLPTVPISMSNGVNGTHSRTPSLSTTNGQSSGSTSASSSAAVPNGATSQTGGGVGIAAIGNTTDAAIKDVAGKDKAGAPGEGAESPADESTESGPESKKGNKGNNKGGDVNSYTNITNTTDGVDILVGTSTNTSGGAGAPGNQAASPSGALTGAKNGAVPDNVATQASGARCDVGANGDQKENENEKKSDVESEVKDPSGKSPDTSEKTSNPSEENSLPSGQPAGSSSAEKSEGAPLSDALTAGLAGDDTSAIKNAEIVDVQSTATPSSAQTGGEDGGDVTQPGAQQAEQTSNEMQELEQSSGAQAPSADLAEKQEGDSTKPTDNSGTPVPDQGSTQLNPKVEGDTTLNAPPETGAATGDAVGANGEQLIEL